eukprot:CAMPEP_0198228416 /NCGR_PEP_ID=MMETSP1445-20131203/113055_1 /TAXON_ID=36898 /ORGANISM="Pyramimonas sp., Strain CCMP2087" /LENGTH=66 /DNA_ID=CAMNT_0043908757 /DNA_START=33 /DNA_END=230 /DNA_ORIENTATION=-
MGTVFKGSTKKEDLCVRLVLQSSMKAFRGWYFQKADTSLGCVWDAKLDPSTAVSDPFCGQWEVKDL